MARLVKRIEDIEKAVEKEGKMQEAWTCPEIVVNLVSPVTKQVVEIIDVATGKRIQPRATDGYLD
ncbi:hypothetical protein [Mailhella sp.]|uniref:hypothetical protein n=1 Tax=Mailhella sp. TaxID=1981029 RepID=UPI004063E54C